MIPTWILLAFIAPALFGIANALDNYLVKKEKRNLFSLLFITTCIATLFLPILFLIEPPELLLLKDVPGYLLIAFAGIVSYYPYYLSLEAEETSIVVSLFSLGRVFLALFAYFLLGELLSVWQYLGMFVIVIAGAISTYDGGPHKVLKKSFWYMMGCSMLWALQMVMYKKAFNEVSWSTGLFWTQIFSTIIILLPLGFVNVRKNLVRTASHWQNRMPFLLSGGLFAFLGTAASMAAISTASVTVVKNIGALQPVYVLVFATMLRPILPKFFHEQTAKGHLLKKMACILAVFIGTYLVLNA
jgi:drug/metabolite transporter (DMT)-like permease